MFSRRYATIEGGLGGRTERALARGSIRVSHTYYFQALAGAAVCSGEGFSRLSIGGFQVLGMPEQARKVNFVTHYLHSYERDRAQGSRSNHDSLVSSLLVNGYGD